MKRLFLTGALLGVLGAVVAGTVAYQIRDQVAYAAEPPPHSHEDAASYLRATVAGCVDAGGTWAQGIEGGVFVGKCYPVPNVGVGPAVRRRPPAPRNSRVAIRSSREREAEDLVGPHTPTSLQHRPGALTADGERSGAEMEAP